MDNPMTQLLFHPDDILFCRDGRPMTGAAVGYGDNLPLPHAVAAALYAALHRARQTGAALGHVHARRDSRTRKPSSERKEYFGGLTNAGPFPVLEQKTESCPAGWYFPRPADLLRSSTRAALYPADLKERIPNMASLPGPLHTVVNTCPPSKEPVPPWLHRDSFELYLQGRESQEGFAGSGAFFTTEHSMGIGINPNTLTVEPHQFFSKASLRFREEAMLGTFARFPHSHQEPEGDLLNEVFPAQGRIRLGGESRTCTVRMNAGANPLDFLPRGAPPDDVRVKWVLLTPAIFPHVRPNENGSGMEHPGGWLPNWVREEEDGYRVQLLDGPGKKKALRIGVTPGEPIRARMVAAVVDRPFPITGWSLGFGEEDRNGARSTLLAVPAGSVYYFEAETPEEARKLADALNWHGSLPTRNHGESQDSSNPDPTGTVPLIKNRRSTLMGEKGFGLGVCGPWKPFQ